MRPTLVRLAESISRQPLDPRHAATALLPPIPLYRSLLRIHRRLPPEMRSLGDSYIRSEFRRHQTSQNPVHIMGFLSQWHSYLLTLTHQLSPDGGGEVRGRGLDRTMLEKMSDEQVGQLWEVMHSAKGVWRTREELEREGRGEGVEGYEEPPADEGIGGKKQ